MPGRISGQVLLVVVLLGAPASAQNRPWWRDPAIRAALELSEQQSAAIDHLFQESLVSRRALREQVTREEQVLDAALRDGSIDDVEGARLIARVEHARMAASVARTLLLARIYRQLTPPQRRRLQAISPDQFRRAR